MKKKIWICGAAGMLGSHFQRLLTERQIPFVANDYKELDITQLDPVSDFVRKQQISHIINCAAYTQVDKAEEEQKQAYLINAMGPHHLAIAARRHGAKLIHFSTDYVFDGSSRLPYTEEHVCAPIGAYGMSKWAGEVKVLNEHSRSCVIRTSWLYGLPGKNFVETMLRLMNEREALRVVSDQIGRPTYCQDLAEAALDLLELDQEGVFHFANSSETSWYQFAREIYSQAKEVGFPLKVQLIESITTKDYPTPAKRPAYSTLSTKKLEQVLGRTPRTWKEALRDYLVKYKHYQESQNKI
jgi:dTDP-4-dehydrorhamnose reductase